MISKERDLPIEIGGVFELEEVPGPNARSCILRRPLVSDKSSFSSGIRPVAIVPTAAVKTTFIFCASARSRCFLFARPLRVHIELAEGRCRDLARMPPRRQMHCLSRLRIEYGKGCCSYRDVELREGTLNL